uniref:Uncharacterized protein n=1 Tax=Anopheles dirus TaxID=7168 RepID=A0A182N4A4_9DIPT
MVGFASVLLPLLVSALSAAAAAGGAPPAKDTSVCGRPRSEVEADIKAWLAAKEKCPYKTACTNANHVKQYNAWRDRCKKVKDNEGVGSPQESAQHLEVALAEFAQLFPPIQADLTKLDEMFHGMDHSLNNELQELQTAVFRSTLASGRTGWGVFYSFLEEKTDPELAPYEASNIPELLRYAWSLAANKTLQRHVYRTIGRMLDSAQDPLLNAIYAVDVASTHNEKLEEREHVLDEQVRLLRSNLTTNSYDTLVEIARRYPEHYAFLVGHLFNLPEGTHVDPAALPAVSEFIRQLPTDEQHLQTTDALLQTLLTENGTLPADTKYVYPLAEMAHDLVSRAGSQVQLEGLDRLRDKFDTPVAGMPMEYYMNLRSSPEAA